MRERALGERERVKGEKVVEAVAQVALLPEEREVANEQYNKCRQCRGSAVPEVVEEAETTTSKATSAVSKSMMDYGNITADVMVQAGSIMQAVASIAQYNVDMAEAKISMDQAISDEVKILTDAFSKMMESAASTMTDAIESTSETVASVQPIFNQIVTAMSEAVSAITSNTKSQLKGLQSASATTTVTEKAPKLLLICQKSSSIS